MALDERKGVWKSGKGKGRKTPKGRQLDDDAHGEVLNLLGDRPRRRRNYYSPSSQALFFEGLRPLPQPQHLEPMAHWQQSSRRRERHPLNLFLGDRGLLQLW